METGKEMDQFQSLEEKVDSLIQHIRSLRNEKDQLAEKIRIQDARIEELTGEVGSLKATRDEAKQRMISLLEKIDHLDI